MLICFLVDLAFFNPTLFWSLFRRTLGFPWGTKDRGKIVLCRSLDIPSRAYFYKIECLSTELAVKRPKQQNTSLFALGAVTSLQLLKQTTMPQVGWTASTSLSSISILFPFLLKPTIRWHDILFFLGQLRKQLSGLVYLSRPTTETTLGSGLSF